MSLERSYRRVARVLPREWRAAHEEDLVATLLDAAEPGRTRPAAGEVLALLRCAAVLRLRRLRRAGLAGAGVLALGLVAAASALAVDEVSAEFVVTSLVVAAVPGTGVVFTVSSAISGGWSRGCSAALGGTLGIVPHVLAAMVGLSGVMQAGAVAFEVVRWVGVAYLVVTGLSMVRARTEFVRDVAADDPGGSAAAVVRRAVLLNLLNPKLTVFFFAFLPQFLPSPPRLLDPRLAALAAVFMAMTLAVFLAYAGASAVVRERVLRAPSVLRWVQRALGGLLVGSAARLALSDR